VRATSWRHRLHWNVVADTVRPTLSAAGLVAVAMFSTFRAEGSGIPPKRGSSLILLIVLGRSRRLGDEGGEIALRHLERRFALGSESFGDLRAAPNRRVAGEPPSFANSVVSRRAPIRSGRWTSCTIDSLTGGRYGC
jgi:hypothetical protein